MNNLSIYPDALTVKPHDVHLYLPPIVWKGDSVGHIGLRDLFFFVLEGECFLHIDKQSYLVRPGQLAFLPKGKLRAYTHASESFTMYEMSFFADTDGENLMATLGLSDGNFVVDVPSTETVRELFDSSLRRELHRDPLYDLAWCESLVKIIRIYAEQRRKTETKDAALFKPVLEYMSDNVEKQVPSEELAGLVYMEKTYFIKKFKACFGLPPNAYFNRMKLYRAMGLLVGTELSIEQIGRKIGFADTSYFARAFKRETGVSPSEYRSTFKKPRR